MRIPVATYRFQFHKGFTFQHARALLPYLRDLGITDVYASPLFLAGPESTHGYDICAFDRLNPNLGSEADFEALASDIRDLGMGLIVDMVPNHMGAHASNDWWFDVLKNGPNSEYAGYFDINWNPTNPLLQGKILLPILGDHYASVLERGELQLVSESGKFHLAYFDKEFPLSPESEKAFNLSPLTNEACEKFLRELNGNPGQPASFDKLHKLIELQHYRLAYWRVGAHEINYRRFFDVTELVSVRVENEQVFHATHRFLLDLLHSVKVTGLRIDHPDGLRDPQTYFERLQRTGKKYTLAEKILSDDEQLPDDWPVHGTTGYDYLIYQNGLFIQRDHEAAFTAIHSRFTGSTEDFESLAYRSKQDVLNHMFIAEVNSLTARIKRVAASSRHGRDFTEADLRTAIIDFIAGFPIYRTYVTTESKNLSPSESAFIQRGLAEARQRTKDADLRALEFLARVLSLDFPADFDEELRHEAREFVVRFQQLSGPATAKGLEDTAFYRYTRFVSLNEVGGNPGHFGIALEEFHEYNSHKQQQWPLSMLATSTHDTKRGEDTRARLNVLSEMPNEWEQKVSEWRALNEPFNPNHSPNFSDEYLLYQVLLGTWISNPDLPAYIERLQNYMLKASREAKTNTSWTEPNESYESATKAFVADILDSALFRKSLAAFASEIAYFGTFNSIAQIILKTCSPGVPDFYQGTELWDVTLVDPDNRRPIDYSLRQKLLAENKTPTPSDLLNNWETGAIKLFTTANALRIRREHPALTSGDYRAISISGARSNHIISFARTSGNSTLLIAVPRFVRTLTTGQQIYPNAAHWADTHLDFDGARFKNLLTGEEHHTLAAADLFKTFPAAILVPLD